MTKVICNIFIKTNMRVERQVGLGAIFGTIQDKFRKNIFGNINYQFC